MGDGRINQGCRVFLTQEVAHAQVWRSERVCPVWTGAELEGALGMGAEAEGSADHSRVIVPSGAVSPNPQPFPGPDPTAGRVFTLLWIS